MLDTGDELIYTEEGAAFAGYSLRTIYRWIKNETLPACRGPNDHGWRIRPIDLAATLMPVDVVSTGTSCAERSSSGTTAAGRGQSACSGSTGGKHKSVSRCSLNIGAPHCSVGIARRGKTKERPTQSSGDVNGRPLFAADVNSPAASEHNQAFAETVGTTSASTASAGGP